jgi:hypothetical protein
MAARSRRPETPQRLPAQRAPRRRLRAAQPIPRDAPATNAELNWRAGELILGLPRANRKARKQDENV